MKKNLCFILLGLVFLVIAVKLFFYGLTEPDANRLWHEKSIRTQGTVIGFDVVVKDNERVRYPVIEYRTDDGIRHSFVSKLRSSNFEQYALKQVLDVRYSRSDNSHALIDTPFHNWGPMVLFVGLGVGALMAGGVLIVAALRRMTGGSR